MPFDLFVSHSSKDTEITRRIHDRLTQEGIEAWVDFIDIHDGDLWDIKIQEALNRAKRGVVILSQNSLNSTHCRGEWQTFITRKLPIFILKIEALKDEEIPYYLRPSQITDLTGNVEIELATLIERITGRPASLPPPYYDEKLSGEIPRWHLDLPIYGRRDELRRILSVLDRENSQHVVQITGIGGIGKSRLAMEIVRLTSYVAGTIWHDCRIASLPTLTATIREHLGMQPSSDEQTWEQVNKYPILIVIDNGEACTEPAAYADVINRLGDQIRVILVSQTRWENLKRVSEFNITQPDLKAASQIMHEFAKRMAGKDIAHDAETLAKAAYQHPRLMEIIASWLRDKKVSEVIDELHSLTGSSVKEALDEMIGRSVQQVRIGPNGEMLISVLRKLSVCRGGFTSEAAKAIANTSKPIKSLPFISSNLNSIFSDETFIQSLKPLRNWGLLRFERDRYEIDPLVIEAIGEDKRAYRAHIEYYEALARQYHEKQDYLGLNPESANLEVAFERIMKSGSAELSYRFATACIEFQANRGRYTQRMMWWERIKIIAMNHPSEEFLANVLHNLGLILQEHPIGNRQNNLRLAISAYEQILQIRTLVVTPFAYAMTQNNLGNAYADLAGIEDQKQNLQYALDAFRQALRFWTSETAPLKYAMTQNNLGATYRKLAEIEDQKQNLQRALDAFRQALLFWTPEIAPLDYAMTQYNIGITYSNLASVENGIFNIRHAIDAYQQALRFWTSETAPLDYAGTQNNLGAAYRNLADFEERPINLHRAIAAYQQALLFWTPETAPIAYAVTQRNLGIAYEANKDIKAAIHCWCESGKHYWLMGDVQNADAMIRKVVDADGSCE